MDKANSTVAGFRLSAQQERICAQTQNRAGVPYCVKALVRIEGPLDSSRLRKSIGEVVVRHEILRTVFHHQPGMKLPFQVIQPGGEPAWQLVDLNGWPEIKATQKVDALFRSDDDGSDLEQRPTLSVILAALTPTSHVL